MFCFLLEKAQFCTAVSFLKKKTKQNRGGSSARSQDHTEFAFVLPWIVEMALFRSHVLFGFIWASSFCSHPYLQTVKTRHPFHNCVLRKKGKTRPFSSQLLGKNSSGMDLTTQGNWKGRFRQADSDTQAPFCSIPGDVSNIFKSEEANKTISNNYYSKKKILSHVLWKWCSQNAKNAYPKLAM